MSPASRPLRGQVYFLDAPRVGPHFRLVVSANPRNAHADDVLATVITSTPPRSPRPSYVPLRTGVDPFEGWVKCDHIGPIDIDQLGSFKGALSGRTMRLVDDGLAFALGLRRSA